MVQANGSKFCLHIRVACHPVIEPLISEDLGWVLSREAEVEEWLKHSNERHRTKTLIQFGQTQVPASQCLVMRTVKLTEKLKDMYTGQVTFCSVCFTIYISITPQPIHPAIHFISLTYFKASGRHQNTSLLTRQLA